MQSAYGVVWSEGAGPTARGRLELLPQCLRLDGMSVAWPVRREVRYADLAQVRVGRAPEERLNGRPSLVLELRFGDPIVIAGVSEPGIIGELADRLAALSADHARSRAAVVLPLAEGSYDAVRELLASGPPFDPDAVGLDRHEVFLTPNEVVFVFESSQAAGALEPLLAEPGLWERAASWRGQLAGPPRIAEGVYAWHRPETAPDTALLPPGLRD